MRSCGKKPLHDTYTPQNILFHRIVGAFSLKKISHSHICCFICSYKMINMNLLGNIFRLIHHIYAHAIVTYLNKDISDSYIQHTYSIKKNEIPETWISHKMRLPCTWKKWHRFLYVCLCVYMSLVYNTGEFPLTVREYELFDVLWFCI